MGAKRKKKDQSQFDVLHLSDFGTPETRAHGEAVHFYSADLDNTARTIRMTRVASCSLDRLRFRKSISKRQFEAGDRYRSDLHYAGMFPRVSAIGWADSGRTGGNAVQHISDERVSADQRLLEAKRGVGAAHTEVLGLLLSFDMMPGEIGYRLGQTSERSARRHGSEAVDLALTALADHYGIGEYADDETF